MLQVFYMDVAKVDRDVAYVTIAPIHAYFKHMFQMFQLFLKRMLQGFLSRCCISFTHML